MTRLSLFRLHRALATHSREYPDHHNYNNQRHTPSDTAANLGAVVGSCRHVYVLYHWRGRLVNRVRLDELRLLLHHDRLLYLRLSLHRLWLHPRRLLHWHLLLLHPDWLLHMNLHLLRLHSAWLLVLRIVCRCWSTSLWSRSLLVIGGVHQHTSQHYLTFAYKHTRRACG